MLHRILAPRRTVHAHCDLPCGVYDPAQARIEAESVKACQEKYQGSDDPIFKERAVTIKEERADLVKHHLWVLWTDYFKPEHLEKYPTCTTCSGTPPSSPAPQEVEDPAQGQQLLDAIDEIAKVFWETKS